MISIPAPKPSIVIPADQREGRKPHHHAPRAEAERGLGTRPSEGLARGGAGRKRKLTIIAPVTHKTCQAKLKNEHRPKSTVKLALSTLKVGVQLYSNEPEAKVGVRATTKQRKKKYATACLQHKKTEFNPAQLNLCPKTEFNPQRWQNMDEIRETSEIREIRETRETHRTTVSPT